MFIMSQPIQQSQINNLTGLANAEMPAALEIPEKRLTRREKEVLTLLVQGESSKDIANRFNIDSKTVDVHRAIIRKKLGIFNIPGLVKYALRTGLISLDD
jgi:DNA-binding CsgD family transcriptional regulator